MTYNKPKLNVQNQQNKFISAQQDHQEEDSDQDIGINHNQQNVQISQYQAQKYLDYLRKKVAHQIKDPFSLPFLNLKFQQLNSWKDVTEQLNLQSRVYGLRVDNCHDGTIKLLNYLIRNQEQQIINQSFKNSQQFLQEKKVNLKPCFHLQNPQKISIKQGVNFEKTSNLIWKTIFKKCQNVSELQMNAIELSSDFSLKINCNDQNICFFNQQIISEINEYFKKLPKSQALHIFQQIQTDLSNCVQQIFDLKARINRNQKTKQRNQFYEYGFNSINSIKQDANWYDNDMLNYYQKLEKDQFQNNKLQQNINCLQQQDINNGIYSTINLKEPHINFNEILQEIRFDQESQEQNDSQKQEEEQQLYQPTTQMIYQTMRKSLNQKNSQNKHTLKQKRKNKIEKQAQRIIFNQFYEDKELALRTRDQKQNNYLKLNNLLPINFVVLYQNRNPFKKIKFVKKQKNRQSFKYQSKMHNIYQPTTQQVIQMSDTQIRLNFGHQLITPFIQNQQNYLSQPQQDTINNINLISLNNQISYSQHNANFRQSKQKTLPIKLLKTQIKKELYKFSHQKINNSFLYSESNLQRKSQKQQNFLYQTETNLINQELGLKYLKRRMKNVDPLDIFTAMLHIAYEQQIVIRLQQNSFKKNKKTCDIIMEESF